VRPVARARIYEIARRVATAALSLSDGHLVQFRELFGGRSR